MNGWEEKLDQQPILKVMRHFLCSKWVRDLFEIMPKPATAALLDFHNYTFKPYAEYFEQIISQES